MKTSDHTHTAYNNRTVLHKTHREVILQEDVKNGNVFEYEKLLYEIFFEKLQAIEPPEELKTRILEHAYLEHYT